jgi:hypothetical protein
MSAKDADLILILDTGSIDKTIELGIKFGATVHQQKIYPWRYDTARNTSLSLIPEDFDVCVAMDMDEYLAEGWRQEIERLWIDGVTRINYMFKVSDTNKFRNNKIHARNGYFWEWPVHECLTADIRLEHKAVDTDLHSGIFALPFPTCPRGSSAIGRCASTTMPWWPVCGIWGGSWPLNVASIKPWTARAYPRGMPSAVAQAGCRGWPLSAGGTSSAGMKASTYCWPSTLRG